MRQNGGYLNVHSKGPGQGTVVEFTMKHKLKSSGSKDEKKGKEKVRKQQLLLIEDDEEIQDDDDSNYPALM